MSFTAKDVQTLRQATGAGMMDAKKALQENDGDFDRSAKWLREKGLAQSAKRADRDNTQGAVAVAVEGDAAAIVQLKSETDFVAKSPDFAALVERLAKDVAANGEAAAAAAADEIDSLKVTLKENIELGRVVRFEAPAGSVLDTYLHLQNGRGVNAVMVEIAGGAKELAHDLAVHIAFARPAHLTRDEFPAAAVEEERATLEAKARNEGKPEAALPKIVEGMMTGFFKAVPGGALLEQAFTKDTKQSVHKVLGDATITRFAQVEIG